MTEILAAATGRPESQFSELLSHPPLNRAQDAILTEAAYQAERTALMAELPGILNWALAGLSESRARTEAN